METITETIWVKHEFKKEDKLDLAQKMAGAEAAISRKVEELKSVTATIKADIATQEGILHSCAEKLRSGYEMIPRECVVTYDKGIATYADGDTGEILQTRPMTQDEQLRLSGNRVDAEQVIREASEED